MKLNGYEWLKLYRRRLLLVLIPVLLFGNGYLYVKDQYDKNGYFLRHIDAYRQLESAYAAMPLEQGYEQIKQANAELRNYRTMIQAAKFPDNPVLAEELVRVLQQSPELQEKLNDSLYIDDLDKLSLDTYMTNLILNQYETIKSYRVYWESIRARADELLTTSIFQDGQSFSYRNLLKTPKDFESLENVPLKLTHERGILSSTTFRMTDACMVITLFLLCIYLFHTERESGLVMLTRTTARGRLPLIRSKLNALICMSVLLSVCFYGSLLIIGEYLYGFGEMTLHVQSMASFRYCNLPISAGQYLILFVACKIFVNILTALIIAALFICLGHAASAYAGLFALYAVEYLCFRYLHPLSSLHIFKYMNLFALYDVHGLLAVYRNLNVGGYPFRYPSFVGISGTVLIILIYTVCLALYTLRYPTNTQSGRFAWITEPLTRLRSRMGSTSLIRHEGHKLLFTGKIYLVLALALVIGYQDLNLQRQQFNDDDAVYNAYMAKLEGSLNQGNAGFVLQERQRFDELPLQYQMIEEQFNEGEISSVQYTRTKRQLDYFSSKNKVFLRVYDQYLHLMELREAKGITGNFINELTARYLFLNPFRDHVNGLTYMILLMLVLSAIFPIDTRNGMVALLRTTRRGRRSLFAVKLCYAAVLSWLIMLILYAPVVFNTLRNYPSMDWNAPVQSIVEYGMLSGSLTIKGFVAAVFALQLLGAWLVCACAIFFTILVRKRATALLLLSVLFVFPFLIPLAGYERLRLYTDVGFFTLFDWFAQPNSLMHLHLYIIAWLVLASAACVLSWRIYNDSVPLGGGRR